MVGLRASAAVSWARKHVGRLSYDLLHGHLPTICAVDRVRAGHPTFERGHQVRETRDFTEPCARPITCLVGRTKGGDRRAWSCGGFTGAEAAGLKKSRNSRGLVRSNRTSPMSSM